jgi:hypothetical protein
MGKASSGSAVRGCESEKEDWSYTSRKEQHTSTVGASPRKPPLSKVKLVILNSIEKLSKVRSATPRHSTYQLRRISKMHLVSS